MAIVTRRRLISGGLAAGMLSLTRPRFTSSRVSHSGALWVRHGGLWARVSERADLNYFGNEFVYRAEGEAPLEDPEKDVVIAIVNDERAASWLSGDLLLEQSAGHFFVSGSPPHGIAIHHRTGLLDMRRYV